MKLTGVLLSSMFFLALPVCAKEFLPKGREAHVKNRSNALYDRTFTDRQNYNTYDHFGLVTGLLDTKTKPISTTLNWRNISLSDTLDITSNSVLMPTITLGMPSRHFVSFYYGMTPAEKQLNRTLSTIKHDFGFYWINQMKDESFRFGFDFDGAAAKIEENDTENSRLYRSLDNLEVIMGSVIHDAAILSFAGGISAVFDSLEHENDLSDRFFEIELPRASTTLEIKDPYSEYEGSLGFTYSRKNYVYSTDDHSNPDLRLRTQHYDDGADAIVTDSIYSHAKSIWGINAGDNHQFNPGLELGITHNYKRRMRPGSDNHPFSYRGEIDGTGWRTTSFSAGGGFSFLFSETFDIFTEYTFSSMNMDIVGGTLEDRSDELHDNSGYHRFNTGFSWGLHNMPNAQSTETEFFLDFSFLLQRENGVSRSWYASDYSEYMFPAEIGSQAYLYAPWEDYNRDVKTRNIATGFRGSFNEGRLETNFNIGFLEQTFFETGDEDYSQSGLTMNMDLIYNVITTERMRQEEM
ncbi:MAG: hypothetical protein ACQEQ4_00090 [Fibrobacterota bacterium]